MATSMTAYATQWLEPAASLEDFLAAVRDAEAPRH